MDKKKNIIDYISIGFLLIRFSIGLLFVWAGINKIVDLNTFVTTVKATGLLPEGIAIAFGYILPFAEIILGILYIAGFLTSFVSAVLGALLIIFIFAEGSTRTQGPPFNYNFILIACTFTTMFAGAGKYSVDNYIKTLKQKKIND